jgi:hypothetical protein
LKEKESEMRENLRDENRNKRKKLCADERDRLFDPIEMGKEKNSEKNKR